MKRKKLGNKIRFEVFKRDSFTCQYCGRKSPDVTLNVDHIKPVSKGGNNDIINLVTSCWECNSGKTNNELDDDATIKKQQKQMEELNERRNQLEMMLEWRDEISELDDMLVDAVVSEFEEATGASVNEQGSKNVKKWLKKYDIETLSEAVEKSTLQYEEAEKAFQMIPRIAYYIVNPEKDMSQLFYIRGILKNRLSYYDPVKAIVLLKKAREYVDEDNLKDIALRVESWTKFREALEDIIETGGTNGG